MEKARKWSMRANGVLGGVSLVFLITGIAILTMPYEAHAQQAQAGAAVESSARVAGFAFLAAAAAVGLSCIAAGIAVGAVGSAAMGAVAERPELMGRSLIYVGLAEGIAIYGLIVSIIILGKV